MTLELRIGLLVTCLGFYSCLPSGSQGSTPTPSSVLKHQQLEQGKWEWTLGIILGPCLYSKLFVTLPLTCFSSPDPRFYTKYTLLLLMLEHSFFAIFPLSPFLVITHLVRCCLFPEFFSDLLAS
jgi:hypothetical protein